MLVQSGAGLGSSLPHESFASVGATVVSSAADVWGEAEMVLKVKEPAAQEYGLMRDGQVLFAYLHLAADAAGTRALLDAGVTAIAYETVQVPGAGLPLLAPMSEVAGRLATEVGAHALMSAQGGRGTLLGGVPSVHPAKVTVLGARVSDSTPLRSPSACRPTWPSPAPRRPP